MLSRDPRAGRRRELGVQAVSWDPLSEPAPKQALEGRDAVVHLAGENVAQRWSTSAKRAIRESRAIGTRHLVEGLSACATSASGTPGDADGDGRRKPGRRRPAKGAAAGRRCW